MDGRALLRLALLAALLVPARLLRRGPTVCVFRRVTGRPCPSCGMTRSWSAAAHLQLRRSFAFHPFGPLTFAAALLVATGRDRGRDLLWLQSPPIVVGLGSLWMAAWLRRLVRPVDESSADIADR